MLVWRSLLRFYMYPSPQATAQLSFNAYRSVFYDADAPAVLQNTAILAFASATVVSALAAAIAWQVLRGPVSRFWRRGLNTLAFAPQALPSIVIGLALIFTYLWVPIPIYGTIWILVLAMVTKYLAYSTGTMIAAQMQISGELEEASKIAGAGGSRTYWRIVVPLITPALAACFLWVMIHVVRELGLALMLYSLRSQVLSTKVWLLWENGRIADACATGILTVIALLVLLALPAVWRSFRRFDVEQVEVETAFGRFAAVARRGEDAEPRLFFRPHHVRVESDDAGGRLNHGTARVMDVQFLGESLDISALNGEAAVNLRLSTIARPSLGQEIVFSLDPSFSIVFVPPISRA
jgi:ABC-type spermidine/putrescine transport system permease subunit II